MSYAPHTCDRQSTTGAFNVILVLLLLAYCVLPSLEEQDFCGNSIARLSRRTLRVRSRRSALVGQPSTSAQRQWGSNLNVNKAKQEPENQQEDQIIIDESTGDSGHSGSSASDSGNESAPRATGARIECPKDRVSSKMPPGASAELRDCYAKTIETAVFIDQALDNKFIGVSGGLVELNKLVLTIMNQVQLLFKYSSMKVPIKIKLVLVEHLKDSEKRGGGQMPNAERGDIDAYLSNFCNWQHNRLEREKRIWWDHAILLSGLDLYKATAGKNHTGVLGLAWVGGMCKGNYSCTINEASNLESAFVIAHEIGHSLGIMHDGQRNTCDPNGFIMSERTGAGKVHWSRCSINYLNDSINKRQLSCLDSEQNSITDPIYDLSKLRLPGQVYTINDQCRLAFGNNYTSFVTRQLPFNVSVCGASWPSTSYVITSVSPRHGISLKQTASKPLSTDFRLSLPLPFLALMFL